MIFESILYSYNDLKIKQENNQLIVFLNEEISNRIDHMPSLVNENKLNHWVDISEPQKLQNDQIFVSYNTKLGNNEYTLAEWKSHLLSMGYKEFKSNIVKTVRAFLELMYYVELGKEWSFPIDPLNIIIETNGDNVECKVFYREDKTLEIITESFMNDVLKMLVYLFIPEFENSTDIYCNKDVSTMYNTFLYEDSDDISIYLKELIRKYGVDELNSLAVEVYNLISDENSSNGLCNDSVKTLLEKTNSNNCIYKVENDNEEYIDLHKIPVRNYKPTTTFEELNDELSSDDNDNIDLSKMSKKERKAYEKQKKRKELEKQRQKQLEEKEHKKQEKKKKSKKVKDDKNSDSDKDNHNLRKEKKEINPELRKQTNKELIICLVSIFLVLGMGYFMFDKNKDKANQLKEEQQKIEQTMKEPRFKKDFYDGLLDSASNDNKGAVKNFDDYFNNGGNMKDLSNKEIASVFATYLESSQYDKILKYVGNEKTSSALVKYLLSEKKYNEIKKLPSGQFKVVDLAKAYVDDDYNKMIQYKDVNVNDNQILQDKLCYAFAKTDNLEEGKSWAETQNNKQQCIDAIKAYSYKLHPHDKDKINKALGDDD